MDDSVKEVINNAVRNILKKSSGEKKLEKLKKVHSSKIHFIPKKYRVFGGVLQSMNIQFGNFIEELMELLIKNDNRYEIISKYSGKKSNSFELSKSNDDRIDSYITKCQIGNVDTNEAFSELLKTIFNDEGTELNKFKHDIDLLFKDKESGTMYYLEIKYNDDHDTGKFVDINRKFIKTYAYLCRELGIKKYDELVPILYFFNNKRMKGNIYVPEDTYVKRGETFFKEFLKVEYSSVDKYMNELSESEETVEMFNELYKAIMK